MSRSYCNLGWQFLSKIPWPLSPNVRILIFECFGGYWSVPKEWPRLSPRELEPQRMTADAKLENNYLTKSCYWVSVQVEQQNPQTSVCNHGFRSGRHNRIQAMQLLLGRICRRSHMCRASAVFIQKRHNIQQLCTSPRSIVLHVAAVRFCAMKRHSLCAKIFDIWSSLKTCGNTRFF